MVVQVGSLVSMGKNNDSHSCHLFDGIRVSWVWAFTGDYGHMAEGFDILFRRFSQPPLGVHGYGKVCLHVWGGG